MTNITVAVIDDHTLLLGGIKDVLESHAYVGNVTTYNSAKTFLEQYMEGKYDLIVTDIDMPDLTGTELIADIKNRYPKQRILVLSMYKNKDLLQNILQLGANGFVGKDEKPEVFHEAISCIIGGEVYLTHDSQRLLEGSNKGDEIVLTKREIEIIQLITRGKSTQEMAKQLFISETTVKTHRQNIRLKLGISNSAELVRYAFEHKLC